MNERGSFYNEALQRKVVLDAAIDIIDGRSDEHDSSVFAKESFLLPIRLLDVDQDLIFERLVMSGRVKLLVPQHINPQEIEPVAAPIDMRIVGRFGFVAMLGPSIWASQEYFMSGNLICLEPRLFRSTRETVNKIVALSQS